MAFLNLMRSMILEENRPHPFQTGTAVLFCPSGSSRMRFSRPKETSVLLRVESSLFDSLRSGLLLPASQCRNRFPGPNKVLIPEMGGRDHQPDLPTPGKDLRRNESDPAAQLLHVRPAIGGRQRKIPHPQRQIVTELSTEQINPVGHKIPHWQMREKLLGKLPDPSLRSPTGIVLLHERLSLSHPIRDNHIIGKALKECLLASFLFLYLTPDQIPIPLLPPRRLIGQLVIFNRRTLRVSPPGLFRQMVDGRPQGRRLIRGDGKVPSFLFAEADHSPVVEGRIASKIDRFDLRGDFSLHPAQKGNRFTSRVRVPRSQLGMEQLVGLMNKGIEGLKRIDAVIGIRGPLLLLPKDFVHLGVDINGPGGHLLPTGVYLTEDRPDRSVKLKQLARIEATAEVGGGGRIGNLRATDHRFERPIFPKGLQVFQIISSAEGVGGQSQDMLRFRIARLPLLDLYRLIEDLRNAKRLRHGIENRQPRVDRHRFLRDSQTDRVASPHLQRNTSLQFFGYKLSHFFHESSPAGSTLFLPAGLSNFNAKCQYHKGLSLD